MTQAPPPIIEPAEVDPSESPASPPDIARAQTATTAPHPGSRFALLAASHAMIDIFPIFFTSLMLVLEERLSLNAWQITFVYMATPVFSGGLQPVFARITDRYDTRLCSPLGLAIGALAIASIGFAQDFYQLVALQIVGVIATGFYHPISTALAGQLGARFFTNGRAQAIGLFIAAGMIGQSLGPTISTRVTERFGVEHLAWLVIPALALALALHLVLAKTPHRHNDHHARRALRAAGETARRWRFVAILAVSNAMRFTANVGMFVMFNTWAMAHVLADHTAQIAATQAADPNKFLAQTGANHAANLSTAMTVGMGLAVITLGRFIKRGRERWPLLHLSLVGAVAMALIGPVGDLAVGALGLSAAAMIPAFFLAALSPIGFFGTFPVATSLAQRLLPEHTSLVTSLMMGAGWAVSASSTLLAPVFFGFVDLQSATQLPLWRINLGFIGFAAILAAAGLLTLLLPKDAFTLAADEH